MLRANSNPDSLAPGLREAVWALDKDQPIASVMSMQQRRSLELGGAPVIQTMLGIFAGLALILAAVGLYGLVAYSVEQRSQEIGIRKTLGAGEEDVLRLIVGDGMKLALIGLAIGLVGAFPLPRAFGSLFPDFHIAGGWIFILVSAVVGWRRGTGLLHPRAAGDAGRTHSGVALRVVDPSPPERALNLA